MEHKPSQWPELKYDALQDTITTVHLWTQIVGKVRMVKMPWLNHSWHVSLYVSSRGLTTGSVPYEGGIFQIEFDFNQHLLLLSTSQGSNAEMKLYPRSVASFYKELFEKLHTLGVAVQIYARPNEIDPAIPFEEDEIHQHYNKEQMHALWQTLVHVDTVLKRFRARFTGKSSPVHFFWGGFDLAVTRFSGREAPIHPGGMPNMPLKVMQEAYSHEVCSAGFWPGSPAFPKPVFYAYCYPTPDAFSQQPILPKEAFYSNEMGEFFLPYDVVRLSENPEETLMQFLQSTYEAAATTGNWDREALDFTYFEVNN
ncbi:MAG: DUF5996 family protein [Flavipsychrobacter sp.]|nr:DUF5996 family protein [Flavipsychrobacter sp.]